MNKYLDNFYEKKDDINKNFIYLTNTNISEDELKTNYKESFYKQFNSFDQLTINLYTPGNGIPPHTDSHSPFEDVLI